MISRRQFLRTIVAAGSAATARAAFPLVPDLCGASVGAPLPRGRIPDLPPADLTLRIARIALEVAQGRVVETTAYNGSVPGPLIRLREGRPVTVDVFNETGFEEWVHWHGLHLPEVVDGAQDEGSLSVPPWNSLRYSLTPRPAGARFVHTHAMPGADLSRGAYSGQFGFVYIDPANPPGRYDREVFLAAHEWEPYFSTDEGMETAVLTDPVHRMREERALAIESTRPDIGPPNWEVAYRLRSINGRALGHGEPVRVRAGERVLFHVLNASATEVIKLSLPGHRFQVVALDGNPVPTQAAVETLELGPAERISALVAMDRPGIWILGSPSDEDRDSGLGVVIEYAGRTGQPRWEAPRDERWSYAAFGQARISPPAEEIIAMAFDRLPPGADGFERWTINGRSAGPGDPPWRLRQGQRYRLNFRNLSDEAHSLHLHRNTFELVEVNGQPTAGVAKDVIVVKDFQSAAVEFTADVPGLSLFHCHQQMHMDCGFKAVFDVS